jgi:hypothetical protein
MLFWGVKGLARRCRGGRAAHQQQGLRLILGVGRYTPTGGNFTTAKVAFPRSPSRVQKEVLLQSHNQKFFLEPRIFI